MPNGKLPQGLDDKKTRVIYSGEKNDTWIEMHRVSGIGASEAAAVLGASRFETSSTLYAKKIIGHELTDVDREAVKWGLLMEPIILQEYSKEEKKNTAHETRTFQSTSIPHMIAGPDGWEWADTTGTIQIKRTIFNWEESGLPKEVWIQMQHELFVTGLDWGRAVVLMHSSKLRHVEVQRDDRFICDVLLPELEIFWSCVTNLEPLPRRFIDGSEKTKKALESLYPEDAETTVVDLGGDLFLLHKEKTDLDAQLKEIKSRADEINNQIRNAIGSASGGRFSDGSGYTLKTVQKKEYTVKATSYRQLRYKEGKK